jgi:hypothetical protein
LVEAFYIIMNKTDLEGEEALEVVEEDDGGGTLPGILEYTV